MGMQTNVLLSFSLTTTGFPLKWQIGNCTFKRAVFVDLLFIVTPIVGVCNCSMFCCTLLYVPSSLAIILIGKRELVALLSLSSWCLVIVVWLFLTVPWVCLQFVIVVCPDHTHYFFMHGTRKFCQKGSNFDNDFYLMRGGRIQIPL